MQPTTIGIEVFEQLFRRDVCAKRLGVAEIAVPNFVRSIADLDKEGVFGFASSADDGRDVVGDGGVCRRAWGNRKWCAPCCRV